jgi:hypothetical protein
MPEPELPQLGEGVGAIGSLSREGFRLTLRLAIAPNNKSRSWLWQQR